MIRHLPSVLLLLLACGAPAAAQPPEPAPPATGTPVPRPADQEEDEEEGTPATAREDERDDAVLDRAQPDFTLINLPTNLRLPQWRSAFRVTHRFTRPLGQGSFGNLVEDLFGLDSSAFIGLEFRFGLLPGTQVGVYRTNSDRTIQLFAQYDVWQQDDTMPVSVAAFGSIDGTNNFRDSYSPAIGAIISRKIDDRVALYAEPFWINNTNPSPSELVDDNSTMLLGLGARLRLRPTVYVVGEFAPRIAGYDPGVSAASLALEKRAGGHAFQLVFSNSLGLTMAQVARGGIRNDDWYLGFNISRKFF